MFKGGSGYGLHWVTPEQVRSPADAREALAHHLRRCTQEFDPEHRIAWTDLDKNEMGFFRKCVEAVLESPITLSLALDDRDQKDRSGIERVS